MTDTVASFLEECGLTHLSSTFADNKIDEISLLYLITEDELKELIPLMGERKKFQRALLQKSVTETKTMETETLASTLLPDSIEISSHNIEIIDGTNIEEPFEKRPRVQFVIESDGASTSSSVSSKETVQSFSKWRNNIADSVLKTYDAINFDMKNLLTSHIIGRAVLIKYENTKAIDNKDRNHLCDIIICHFLNEGKRLNNAVINILADKIIEIFKEEKKSTYYVSPIGKNKSRNNRPEVAKGKLIDKHRNKLTMLKKTLANSDIPKAKPEQDMPTEIKDSQVWLKYNSEPKDEVIHHWKKSFPIREIAKATLSEFFEQWPILKTQAAIDLIEYDFGQRFDNLKFFNMRQKFDNFFNYIYEKRKTLLKPSDQLLFNLLGDQLTTDSKVALQLFLLSALVPPRGRARTGKTYWKPSISEARDGIFLQVQIPGDIESAKREKVNCMYQRGLTVQPYILIVGRDLNNVHAFYVIIDGINYQTTTLLDAVKFCFQTYFVLDIKYPPESQHLWFLLQWELFNITSEKDVKLPFINDILQFKH